MNAKSIYPYKSKAAGSAKRKLTAKLSQTWGFNETHLYEKIHLELPMNRNASISQ